MYLHSQAYEISVIHVLIMLVGSLSSLYEMLYKFLFLMKMAPERLYKNRVT
jgi:hypothetical protein